MHASRFLYITHGSVELDKLLIFHNRCTRTKEGGNKYTLNTLPTPPLKEGMLHWINNDKHTDKLLSKWTWTFTIKSTEISCLFWWVQEIQVQRLLLRLQRGPLCFELPTWGIPIAILFLLKLYNDRLQSILCHLDPPPPSQQKLSYKINLSPLCHPWQNTKLSFTYCIIRGLVSNTKGFESLDEIAWCLARVTNTSPLSPGSLVSFMSWTSHLPGGKLTKYYQRPFDTILP